MHQDTDTWPPGGGHVPLMPWPAERTSAEIHCASRCTGVQTDTHPKHNPHTQTHCPRTHALREQGHTLKKARWCRARAHESRVSEYAFHWVDIAKGLSSEAGVFSLGVFQAEISLGFVCLGGVHVFFVVVYSSNSP